MDQLKSVLVIVKKYHFWVLCGITVVVPLALAFTAGGQISRNTKARATEVASIRTQVKQVKDTANPPNESAKQVVDKAHEGLRAQVYGAWASLYDVQAERNKWPEVAPGFRQRMEQLPPDARIDDADRFAYQYFIRKHIPKLFLEGGKDEGLGLSVRMTQAERDEYKELVLGRPKPKPKKPPAAADAKPDPNDPAAKASPKPEAGTTQPAVSEELQGILDWDYSLRQEILDRYTWDRPPFSSQMRIAQEDLWVLESLVRIFNETNKNATSQYNAPLKAIKALAIGREAAQEMAISQPSIFQGYGAGAGTAAGYGPAGASGYPGPGGVPGVPGGGPFTGPSGGSPMGPAAGSFTGPSGKAPAPAPAAPSGAAGGPSSDMGSGGGMGPGRFPGMAGAGGLGGQPPAAGMMGLSEDEQWAAMLKDFRYVDQNGNPLPYNATPPSKQFKMIPVHMVLGIDQREIPRLLANCANSDMPVVVRRVSIHPQEGGAAGLSGSSGGVTGPSGGGDMGRPKGSSTPGRSQMPGAGVGGMKKGGDIGKARSPGRGPSGPSGPGATMADEFSDEAVVEVQGIIYLFNPPDRKTLAPGEATPAQPAAPSAPGPVSPAQSAAPSAPGQVPPAQPAPGAGVPAAKP